MSSVTEEDVLISYLSLIERECLSKYKGLEPEDRINEGMMAFLQPVRTYRPSYGSFQSYAFEQMHRIMRQQNAKARAQRKPDSCVSLNASLKNRAESGYFTLIDTIGNCNIDDCVLDVEFFIKNLPAVERTVVIMRINGYSIQNIANELTITQSCVIKAMNRLKVKYNDFFGQ